MEKVAILGSTGSIGVSTLDVLARHPSHAQGLTEIVSKPDENLLVHSRNVAWARSPSHTHTHTVVCVVCVKVSV